MTDPAATRLFVARVARDNPGIRYADMCESAAFLDKDVNCVLDAMIADGSLTASGHENRLHVPARRRRSRCRTEGV